MRMKSGGDIILDKMEKGLTERETRFCAFVQMLIISLQFQYNKALKCK